VVVPEASPCGGDVWLLLLMTAAALGGSGRNSAPSEGLFSLPVDVTLAKLTADGEMIEFEGREL
jgi:hypothetical protein